MAAAPHATARDGPVFISYARDDVGFARDMRERLRALGHQPWMDIFDISPGARWPTEIDRSLREPGVVLGLLSPAALSSENVLSEWDWAIANGRRLILLLIEPCEIPFHYVSRSYLDFTSDQASAFEELLRALDVPLSDDGARPVVTLAATEFPVLATTGLITRRAVTMVGRDDELGQLRGHLRAALGSEGSLVLLGGEAGIGKTTISTALCQEAAQAGALVLAGGCYDLTTTAPYGPWIEIIRAFPEGEGLPPVPDQLRAGRGLTGVDSQAALFELVGRFLARVAAVRPLVLLLEDQHWADQASLDLLRYLSRVLSVQRVLFVATYRDDEIGRDHALSRLMPMLVREGRSHRVHLRRLSHDAVLALLREKYLLPPDDEARLIDYLERLAEGNPFFTHELLFMLEEQRLLTPAAGGWRLGDLTATGVPSLIQQVIDGRLARLGTGTRALLDIAAVIGHEVRLNLLQDAHGGSTGETDTALREATEHHLLLNQPGQNAVRFNHALVRQTIYEDIPAFRRQSLHRRVGETLISRTGPDPAAVASHFHEAGDERALIWLTRAAEQAEHLFAPEAVIAACGQALELAQALGAVPPPEIYRLRGRARESIGNFDGALADHQQVLALARQTGDVRAEWQALLDLGALWASRDYGRTRDYCEQAVALARSMGDPVALGQSLNRLGNWHVNTDRPGEAVRLHNETLELFESVVDRQGAASTLDLAAMANAALGDVPEAIRLWARAVPLLQQVGDRQTLSSALASATTLASSGRVHRCCRVMTLPASIGTSDEEAAAEAAHIARSIGSRAGECYAMSVMGAVASAHGRSRDALRYLSDAVAIAEEIEHHHWIALTHIDLGIVMLELAVLERARAHFEYGLSVATMVSSSLQATSAVGFLASVHVQQGSYDVAARLLHDTIDFDRLPESLPARVCWSAAAELQLARNRPGDALDVVETLLASIPPGPTAVNPYLTRLYGAILAANGRLDDAERELLDAHQIAEQFNYPHTRWRTLAAQRQVALARNRADKALQAEAAARDIIDRLAAQLDDEEMRQTFLTNALARLHEPPPAGTSRSAAKPAGLTVREVEVLRLVARGLSDAEVSDELYISPRTVSQHLRSIYNKLDVNNRTAAVHAATERNVL